MYKIIEKGSTKESDNGIKNKFRWQWLDQEVRCADNLPRKPLREFIRKIDLPGKALCVICSDVINYGSRGLDTIIKHCRTKKHVSKEEIRNSNYTMPASFKTTQATKDIDCNNNSVSGVPGPVSSKSTYEKTKRLIPVDDRIHNAEAMVLSFVSEHSLSFSLVPSLIGLCQELSRDLSALNRLSMDRTSASYKLIYGVSKTLLNQTLEKLRDSPFSLNIDECTSETNKRVLGILVTYLCPKEEKVVVEHLAAIELITVNTKSILSALDELFESNHIPWKNLVSILMDSCAVMRGSKNGLEKRIREERAPQLLDIDGDICHHIHNASRKFCKPFDSYVEKLFMDLYNDHRWSVDLKEMLAEICQILGIKFTKPANFVSHRWLSCYDVAISTLRMWDCYYVFYGCFLNKDDQKIYKDKISQILTKNKVDKKGKARIREIADVLKTKNLTDDGRNRKKRIIEKILFCEQKSQLILHFYTSVLPLLKKYVMLFQCRDPLAHKLHDKQEGLFRDFLSCFVKQENILEKSARKLKKIPLDKDNGQFLNERDMFLGKGCTDIINKSHNDDIVVKAFLKSAAAAYITCGAYLQEKLPLDNKLLKAISCLDPMRPIHSHVCNELKKLKDLVPSNLTATEYDNFDLEVHTYLVDRSIPTFEEGSRADSWWVSVKNTGKYPGLCKVALSVCTIFHGPMVESSFNLMGDILHKKAANTHVETYGCRQRIKYWLSARNKTAITAFSRKQILFDPVDPLLCRNLKFSSKEYRDKLKQVSSKQKTGSVESKKAAKLRMEQGTNAAHTTFRDRLKGKARLQRIQALQQLAAKRKTIN